MSLEPRAGTGAAVDEAPLDEGIPRRAATSEDVLEILNRVATISDRVQEATGLSDNSTNLNKSPRVDGDTEVEELDLQFQQVLQRGEGRPATDDSTLNSTESIASGGASGEGWLHSAELVRQLSSWIGAGLMAACILSANFSTRASDIIIMLVVSMLTGALAGPVILSLVYDPD